jgi:hypothetical protein
MDPIAQLAALAQTREQLHQRLQEITPIDDDDLRALWQSQAEQLLAPNDVGRGSPDPMLGAGLPTPPNVRRGSPDPAPALIDQFLVLVTRRDEKEQVELLGRLKEEGRECKALMA